MPTCHNIGNKICISRYLLFGRQLHIEGCNLGAKLKWRIAIWRHDTYKSFRGGRMSDGRGGRTTADERADARAASAAPRPPQLTSVPFCYECWRRCVLIGISHHLPLSTVFLSSRYLLKRLSIVKSEWSKKSPPSYTEMQTFDRSPTPTALKTRAQT